MRRPGIAEQRERLAAGLRSTGLRMKNRGVDTRIEVLRLPIQTIVFCGLPLWPLDTVR